MANPNQGIALPPLITGDGNFQSISTTKLNTDNILTNISSIGNITTTGSIITPIVNSTAGDTLTIESGYDSGGIGLLTIKGGDDTGNTITGGNVSVLGGEGLTGGYVWLTGGEGSGTGGGIAIRSGAGDSSGSINIQSGNVSGATGTSGNITISAWFGYNGGDVSITSGLGVGGTSGDVNITASAGGNLILNVEGTTYTWPTVAPTNGQTLTATVPGVSTNVDLTWV